MFFHKYNVSLILERPWNHPIGFSDQKIEALNQSNETFSTCSPIMNTSFDVNFMMWSLIIYAELIMQIKVWKFLAKFVLVSFFPLQS